MKYQAAGGNFFGELYGVLTTFEGPHRDPKNIGDGVITMGVGYNLTSGDTLLRTGTFEQLGLKIGSITSPSPSAVEVIERSYLVRLDTALKAGPSQIPALHQIMGERAAKATADPAYAAYLGTATPRTRFEFSAGSAGDAEMKAVMQQGIQPYINRADARLGYTNGAAPAGYAGSWEQAALVSLAYNGLGAWPSALTQAIKAGDRAEAWYQIRYKSNSIGSKYSQGIALTDIAGTTKDEQGNFDQGIDKGWAKRRFAESELFGLYDNPSNVTAAEAREVLQTIQEHRAQIIAYEKAYGLSPDGSTATRGNQVALAASHYSMLVGTKTLTESLNPAKTVFLNDLRASNPELADKLQDVQWLSTNIYVAGDGGGTIDTLPYQTGSFAAGAAVTLPLLNVPLNRAS